MALNSAFLAICSKLARPGWSRIHLPLHKKLSKTAFTTHWGRTFQRFMTQWDKILSPHFCHTGWVILSWGNIHSTSSLPRPVRMLFLFCFHAKLCCKGFQVDSYDAHEERLKVKGLYSVEFKRKWYYLMEACRLWASPTWPPHRVIFIFESLILLKGKIWIKNSKVHSGHAC